MASSRPNPRPSSDPIRGRVRALSVAPMMDRTDRHFRGMLRAISAQALLYTEMITTGAILHGDRARILAYGAHEHPVALQLGGDDPAALAECARIAEGMGYDEVNLNVGCPSSRVQSGCFGVVLMRRPEAVARAVEAMRAAVALPVTVKHRIGLDELDAYEDMERFVRTVASAGADRFTVHARKAWTEGLSPKENREIPPLRYDDVHRLKQEHPGLVIEINGGLGSIPEYLDQLRHVDAVMVGRAAWDDPWHLAQVDPVLFGVPAPSSSREHVATAMIAAVDRHVAEGGRSMHVLRHLLNLFAGVPGTRAWKRILTDGAHAGRGGDVIVEALAAVRRQQDREATRAESAAPR